MKAEDLLRRYADGKRDFSWADLSGENLTNANLAKVNLYGANLAQAVLVRANFQQANLLKANLTNANLTGANLAFANLRKANLTAAKLEGTDLEGAVLMGAIAPDGKPFLVETLLPEQPEAAQPESLPERLIPPATPPKRITTLAEFRLHLPWASLVCSAIGFSFFGSLLLLHQVTIVSWWIVWAIALLGVGSEAFTWLVPILPAITVVMAAKSIALQTESVAGDTTLWQLLMVVAVAGATFCCLKFVMSFTWQRSLRDTIFIAGVGLITIQLFVWTISGSGLVALLLVMAISFTTLGTIAWAQMQDAKFSRWQIRWTVGMITAVGLLAGRGITSAVISQ